VSPRLLIAPLARVARVARGAAVVAAGLLCTASACVFFGGAPAGWHHGSASADEGEGEGEGDATCGAPNLGGLALDTVDDAPGYDDALAALDLAALPASITLSSLSQAQHDLVLYMLDLNDADAIDRDTALATPLGRAVLGAFAQSDADGGAPGALDFAFLRRGLFRFYACERAFPATLTQFTRDIFDPATDTNDVVDSDVKNLRRRITRSASAGAFVAETLLDDDTVRETEVILTDRRHDGHIDFLEYGEDGALRSASQFATGNGSDAIGAVPFTCIACHTYSNVSPELP
jgi:hypothetical protein